MREPKGVRVFAPMREPLFLTVGLVAANVLLQQLKLVSSIYHLAAVILLEGLVCVVFFVRMAISWRDAKTSDVLPS